MKKILLSFILSASLLASCNTEPTACFEASKREGVKVDEDVHFNAACSEESTSYNWDFGDGMGGSGLEVNHSYDAAGTYEVKLTTQNAGQSSQATARIIVVN